MTIQTAEDYQAANAAMVNFETRNHAIVKTEAKMIEPKKAIVRCPDDYERAKERIAETGNLPSTPEEEAELFGLIEAVEKWDARHEDDD